MLLLINHKKELLSGNQIKLENLEEKFINSEINNETYKKWSNKLNIENARLKDEIYNLSNGISEQIQDYLKLLPNMLNFKTLYEKASISQKNALIKGVFKHGIIFENDTYRTLDINPAFRHNFLNIKEKSLITFNQAFSENDTMTSGAQTNTDIEFVPYGFEKTGKTFR